MTVREALERGLTNIRTYGWRQGSYGNSRVGYCAAGAIPGGRREQPQGRNPSSDAVWALAYLVPSGMDLSGWNDRPGRTQADVEALYLRAIEAERA